MYKEILKKCFSIFQANFFLLNLAFSDTCMFLTQGPLMYINAFTSRFWMYGSLLCKLYAFAGGVFGTASILTLLFIAIDRYNVILYGITGHRVTYTKVYLGAAFIWTYSIGVCLPPFFGWGGYKLGNFMKEIHKLHIN